MNLQVVKDYAKARAGALNAFFAEEANPLTLLIDSYTKLFAFMVARSGL